MLALEALLGISGLLFDQCWLHPQPEKLGGGISFLVADHPSLSALTICLKTLVRLVVIRFLVMEMGLA